MTLAHLLLRVRGSVALTDPEVVNVLRLTESQVVRIRDVHRNNHASLRDRIRSMLSQSGRRQQSLRISLQQLSEDAERRAFGVLDDEQKSRLARLIQTAGN
ncbi:MAG: hypothetical protein AB7F89_09845 [Pirellulaceae bacterium]